MSDVDQHASRIAEIMESFESSSDDGTRQRVFELVEHVDHLHRTCVWRLFELMTELGGKGFVERITADPLVKTLFVLYDLVPTDPIRPVQSDVDVVPANAGAFIPLRNVGGRALQWKVAFALDDLQPGVLKAVEIEGVPVLLYSLERRNQVFAFRNTCPGSALPLHLGSIAQGELHCPWHGCRYDPRTGKQIGGSGLDLEPFNVTVREGNVFVAMYQPSESHA